MSVQEIAVQLMNLAGQLEKTHPDEARALRDISLGLWFEDEPC